MLSNIIVEFEPTDGDDVRKSSLQEVHDAIASNGSLDHGGVRWMDAEVFAYPDGDSIAIAVPGLGFFHIARATPRTREGQNND